MIERPILFNAPMVRAILDGTKTQTRRVVKGVVAVHSRTGEALANVDSAGPRVACPYGQPGDRLWVRETFGHPWHHAQPQYFYRATDDGNVGRHPDFNGWKPSIHMPRAASRIILEVTGVRVERLQDISQRDAIAEGAPPSHPSIDQVSRNFGYADFSRSWYAQLWESINGPGSWGANPWVWVVEFNRIREGGK